MTEAVKNALANRGKLVDAECVLKGAATTKNETSGAGSDSTGALIFDTGGGYTEAVCVIDVNSMGTLASGVIWGLNLQGSNDSAFATPVVEWKMIQVGTAAQRAFVCLGGPTRDNAAAARYIIPISNDWGGDLYRYLRIYAQTYGVSPQGTLATIGLNYEAYLSVN